MASKKSAKKKGNKKQESVEYALSSTFPLNKYLWIFGVPMLLGFLVFYPFLFGPDLFIFKDIGSDTLNLKYPNLIHLDRYLRDEGFPMAWSFYVGMGQNMYSGWHFGLEELFHSFFSLVTDSTAYRISWVAWMKTVAISFFAFQWLSTRIKNDWISLIGALSIAFSGYAIVGGTWYVHDAFVLNAVFVLYGLELVWMRKAYWVLPLAMYNFGVDPKLFFFFQFTLLYFILRGVELKWTPVNCLKNGAYAAGLAIIGFLGNATGLLTRITTVTNSPRMSTGASLSDELSSRPLLALHDSGHFLTTWMRTLSNDLLGVGSDFAGWNNYLEAPLFYSSLLMILLIPQLFLLGNRKEKQLWGAALGIMLLPLIFPYFRYAIYLFQGDYYKKALSLFVPLLIVLIGTKSLDLIWRQKRIHLIGLAATAIIMLVSLHYPYFEGRLELNKGVQGTATFVTVLFAISLSTVQFKKMGAALPLILLLVLGLDLGFNSGYGFSKRDTMSKRELKQRVGYNDFTVEAIDFIKNQDSGFYRLTKDYASANSIHTSLNEGRVLGFYGTTQYSSFNQANYIRFLTKMALIDSTVETATRWAIGVESNQLLFPFAGVDYLLRRNPVQNPILANSYSSIGAIQGINIYKSNFRIPFGSFYSTAIRESEVLSLSPNQRSLQVYNHLILSDDDLDSEGAAIEKIPFKNLTVAQFQGILTERRNAGRFQMSRFEQNKIEGTIENNEDGWLFFTIPFDEGWTAIVDGQKIKPVRAQFGFTAIPVKKENSVLSLEFTPAGSKIGAYVSLLALLLVFVFGYFDFKRRPVAK